MKVPAVGKMLRARFGKRCSMEKSEMLNTQIQELRANCGKKEKGE